MKFGKYDFGQEQLENQLDMINSTETDVQSQRKVNSGLMAVQSAGRLQQFLQGKHYFCHQFNEL